MSLFDRCGEFNRRIDVMKKRPRVLLLARDQPPASPAVTMGGRRYIMLGSNNYLGLALDPAVIRATVQAVEVYGTGACSSRVLTGTSSLHNRLERKLAQFKGRRTRSSSHRFRDHDGNGERVDRPKGRRFQR